MHSFTFISFDSSQAISHLVQGSSSDLMKQAIIHLYNSLQQDGDFAADARLVLMLHNSFLFEVPSTKVDAVIRRLKTLVESVYELNPPLLADFYTGTTWGSMSHYSMDHS
jgi:DNA polymerase I-like protein with 3'-5' exonuclease and polymerase domains